MVTLATVKFVALPVPVGFVPAVVTVPPLKAIVGVVVKPLPELLMVMPDTTPPVRTAVPVAPEPPPPEMVTVGAAEYTVVPPLMVKLATVTPRLAVAVAPVPPPPLTVMFVALLVPPLPAVERVAAATPLEILA